MTPQEQQMLQDLANRINQTVLQDKDPDAERFLIQSLSRNPDAVYILAQTVLVQQYALDQAKKQLDDLKQQAQQAPPAPVRHTSFLGGLLGNDEPQRPAPPPPPQYGQSQYQPVPNYAPPAYAQPQYAQPQYGQPQYAQPTYAAPSQGGGFLRGALQTAGGVAAGALAFEGIESLMHGFGEHAGYGGGSGFGGMGGMGMGQPREEIVNNYYGEDPNRGGISRDIEDRRDDNRDNFAGNSDSGDTYTNDDDSTNIGADDYGDNSSDDSSGSDNYGSDDNS
jgi:hypothetical protein